jgi:hypothetical protein
MERKPDGVRLGNITYEFRVFVPRCETYAIRFDGLEITGVCGPLEYDEALFDSLPYFDYTDESHELDWVKSNLNEFLECEIEYDDSVLWI